MIVLRRRATTLASSFRSIEMALGSPPSPSTAIPFEKTRVSQPKKVDYGLRQENVSPVLERELSAFYRFMTQESYASDERPIRGATADVYLRHAKLALGWVHANKLHHQDATTTAVTSFRSAVAKIALSWAAAHRKSAEEKEEEDHSSSNLTLRSVFPTDNDAARAFDFLQFIRHDRGVSPNYEANVIRGLVKLAKFLHHRDRGHRAGDIDARSSGFDLVPSVCSLRKMHKDATHRSARGSRAADEGKKWINWPQFLEVVELLRHEALRTETPKGKQRSPRAIAESQQRYLIAGIFACVPDRQRTLRELEIGSTLLRDDDGSGGYYIKHGAADYKTGGSYGERPPLALSHELTSVLEDFIAHGRRQFNQPEHNRLFCAKNGKPITANGIYSAITKATYRYTGQRCNPHLLRDSIVTHVRGTDASERQLESLALMMGHSLQMQKTSYDRRSKAQKVLPAVELIRTINETALSSTPGSGEVNFI